MAGLYIHIPFCKSKCAYCGFYSLPSLKLKDRFLETLKAEIVARKDYLQGDAVNTIYFGGGTPSLLSLKEIGELLNHINAHYPVASNAEITLEANPDTLSLEYLEGLRQLGVNRLSIGIQSFFDNDLKYLSRRHDSHHAQNAEQWNKNLDIFFVHGLPHLSAYSLTLEPNAILTKQIELGKVQPVNEDDALRDYEILCQRAAENGYLHYEISNYCKSEMHSKHNASYWFGTPYIGFGPSAHSFDGNSRQWNVSSVEKYCVSVPEPVEGSAIEKEILSPEQHYDEYVMLRLRTHWGIDLKWLKREMGERFSTYCEQHAQPMLRLRTHWGIDLKWLKREMGERFSTYCEQHAQPLIAQGRLSQTREFLYLTDQQMLFADGIAEELFWEKN